MFVNLFYFPHSLNADVSFMFSENFTHEHYISLTPAPPPLFPPLLPPKILTYYRYVCRYSVPTRAYLCSGLTTWDWTFYSRTCSRRKLILLLSRHWSPITLRLGVEPCGISPSTLACHRCCFYAGLVECSWLLSLVLSCSLV